jgi:branched-chain amino acid transport system substrate-binding protein
MTLRWSNRRLRRVICAGAAAGALAAAGIVPATTASAVSSSRALSGSPVVFHAVLSETGFAAALGATEAKALQVLAKEVNSTGGIDGHPMTVTIKDNDSTPSTAVSFASKWVSEHVPFLLNGSVTATNRAVDALATSSGPFIYDLSPGDYPKPTSTVFSAGIATSLDAQAYLTFFKAKGLRRVAIINGTTSSGANGYTEFEAALKTKKLSGFTVTDHQTFTPTAPSVTTQLSAIKASHPQALVIWVTGSPLGTVLKGMSALGMDSIPTVTTDGDASYGLLTKLKSVLPKTLYFPTGPLYLPPKDLPPGPVRSDVQTFDKVVAAAGGHGGDPWGLAYTPALLLVGALKKLGIHATARQITNYMEHLHHVAGIYGYYTTSPTNHKGTILRDLYITTFNGTSFVPHSGPGGVPTS